MFYGFVITEGGNRLLAKMVAGQTLELTRIVIDKGTVESVEAARKLTAPIEPGPEGTSSVPTVDGNTANMIVEYRSDLGGGLAEGFWIGGFSVYARDPDNEDPAADVMIYYGSLGDAKQYVSAYTPGTAPDVRRYPVSIVVTAGVEVSVNYPAEAWMTAQDVADYFDGTLKLELQASLTTLIQTHDMDPDAHSGLRAMIQENTDAAAAALEAVGSKITKPATPTAGQVLQYQSNDWKPATLTAADVGLENVESQLNGKAPTNHASSSNTYGLGTDTLYGHTKLLHEIPNGMPTQDLGVAASPLLAYNYMQAAVSKIKRTCQLVVGTAAAGLTEADCDYLCDGEDDQVEINAAIKALPSIGGEIVFLNGEYILTAAILMNKNCVKLRGNGFSTVLNRMYNSASDEGVIHITSSYNIIDSIQILGNKRKYDSINNHGIYLKGSNNAITRIICKDSGGRGIYSANASNNNTITENTFNSNYAGVFIYNGIQNTISGNLCDSNNYGIAISSGGNNTITGNTCSSNKFGIYITLDSRRNTISGNLCNSNDSGIYMAANGGGRNTTITGNACIANSVSGIYIAEGKNNTIAGNTCTDNDSDGIYTTNGGDNTITGNTCDSNDNGISAPGGNGSGRNTITGNACNSNATGIFIYRGNHNNTISGNTCNYSRSHGIYITDSNSNAITGNTCIYSEGLPTDYTASQSTINLAGTSANNLISNNVILGKNYTNSSTGTGNTFVNNKYN